MQTLLYIVASTALISAASLVGVITLSLKLRWLQHILMFLVALAAGTMMGAALLHLLPEAIPLLGETVPFYFVLAAFFAFFVIEKVMHWHHTHDLEHAPDRTLGYMNLIGDLFHNFLDGLMIAGTYVLDYRLGLATSIAVIMHEIPQEIGDFAVLLHSGFSRRTALLSNFLVGLTAVAGGVVGYFASSNVHNFATYLLPFSAGSLLYISAADLVPELKEESHVGKSLSFLSMFAVGALFMYFFKD